MCAKHSARPPDRMTDDAEQEKDVRNADGLETLLRREFGGLVTRDSPVVCGVSFPGQTSRILVTLRTIALPRSRLLWVASMVAEKVVWNAEVAAFLTTEGANGVIGRYLRAGTGLLFDLRVLVGDMEPSEMGAMVHHVAEGATNAQRWLQERGWVLKL
jgi:hypothetical protein